MGKTQLKVVHLTSAHPRDDIRIFHKECCSLVRAGYDVTLVVADGKGNGVSNGVAIQDAGYSHGRLKRMLWTTFRVLSQAIKLNADVYHLHDPELIPAGLWLKTRGKRVVFDAHEDVPKQILSKSYLPSWTLRFLSRSFAVLERFACKRFNGVIAATPTIRDKFLAIHTNSLDVNNYPILGELESDITWASKQNEICYVGSISATRGVRELVKAMELVQLSITLNLVGAFAEPEIETEVRGYPGWQSVNPMGVKDRQGVRAILGRCVAGLVTLHPQSNYLEALPIKMFEYMSAGVPVIASNFDLWRRIVSESACGLCVDPQKPEEIAAAIDYLMANPTEAQRMGENGRQAVLSRYNWQSEETKLFEFYRQILSVQIN